MSVGEIVDVQHSTEYSLRDIDPVVSMDIALGSTLKEGHTIEVDYAQLRKTAQSVGANTNLGDLSIHVYKPSKLGPAGEYNTRANQVRIGFDPKPKKISRTQKTLQHEIMHFADKRRLEERSLGQKISYAVGSLASGYGLPAILPLTMANTANTILTFNNEVDTQPLQFISESIDKCSTAIQFGTYGVLLSTLLYTRNKFERRAKEAAKQKLEPVFTIGSA